jgi:hypothetical protein
VDGRARRRRGKRSAPAPGDGGGGWDWGGIYATVATATGWRFADIDALSLDDLADLWAYWQDHPPLHVSAAALLRAWGGKATPRPPAPRAASSEGDPRAGAMEGIAAVLGPPTHKFRPPCRMLEPDQTVRTSAP